MTYRKRRPVSLEHLDTTIWRPVEKFGIVIPDYYINKKAQIYSYKSHSFLKPSIAWHVSQKNVRTVKNLQYTLSCDTDLFKDYNYSIKSSVRGGNKIDKALVRLKAHIGCKSIWEPIDDYIHELGITKEDWVATPETVRQIVRENAIIDHRDDDPTNNDITNLKWSTQKENSVYRKHKENKEYLEEVVAGNSFDIRAARKDDSIPLKTLTNNPLIEALL